MLLLILPSFLLLRNAFIQCFLLTKRINSFLDLAFLSIFPNRLQASILLTVYSLSYKIEATVFSNWKCGFHRAWLISSIFEILKKYKMLFTKVSETYQSHNNQIDRGGWNYSLSTEMLQKFANIAQIKILVLALFKLGYFSLHIFYPY